jgi:hypothetical protein
MQIKFLTIIILLFVSISSVKSQNSVAISKLLKADKMLDNYLSIIDVTIDEFKNDFDEIPVEFWEKQREELKDQYTKSIENRLTRIYSKFLSKGEILEAIDYFEKKNISTLNDSYFEAYQKAIILGVELVAEMSQNVSDRIENSKFFNNTISVEEFKEFRKGNFVHDVINGIEVKVEKNDSIQFTRFRNNFIRHEITYLNDCDYALKIVQTNDENMQADIGNSIEIYPYEVVGKKMKFKSMVMTEGGWVVKYGELIQSQ